MSGRYERVNAHDDDDADSQSTARPRRPQPIPNSPPPSFHSRASSRERQNRVDPALADAFDDSGDDSDNEADDTQRLVRSTPAASGASPSSQPSSSSSSTHRLPQPVGGSSSAAHQPMQSPPPTAVGGAAQSTPFRVYGGGMQSDGVFSNLTAKPERGEEKEEQPPTYEQAAADAAPPYWETTILAPGLGGPDEVYIDGMPVGSVFSFIWNGMISISFQFVGFLLTYLLHSTHAAKNGSRAGLGVTLIQYGFYMKGSSSSSGGSGAGAMGSGHPGGTPEGYANPPDPNAHEFDPNTVGSGNGGGGSSGGGSITDVTGWDWVAYILMIVGWFILIRSVSDFIRARRHEQLVLQSPDRGLGVAVVAEGETPDRVV